MNNLLYNCSELYITNCRGGEGNVLWGKYFHDSSFDMKLTDIMFNMSYVAANCGSDLVKGGDVFKDEQLVADASGVITLSATAVPFAGSSIFAYVRNADSASDKRKKMSESHIGKCKGENNGMYGKHCSEESKNKIREKLTGNKNPSAKKVQCIETGEIFDTIKQAGEWCHIGHSDISALIRGKQKSAGKHPSTGEKLHWKYVE